MAVMPHAAPLTAAPGRGSPLPRFPANRIGAIVAKSMSMDEITVLAKKDPMRKPMQARKVGLVMLFMAAVGLPLELQAQDAREEAIKRAFDEPNPGERILLLRVGLNPNDGLAVGWQDGLPLMAETLFEVGDSTNAVAWLRWGARLSPGLVVDNLEFPSVVMVFEGARAFVGVGSPGDPVTETLYLFRWQPRDRVVSTGQLWVEPSVAATAQVVIKGLGPIPAAEAYTLAPGSYDIRVSAPGYLDAHITREVLAGVLTVITVTPAPYAEASQLSAEASTEAYVARVISSRFGAQTCAAGVLAGRDGLLLTTYQSIRGSDSVQVQLSDGGLIPAGVVVAAYDVDADIAVLSMPPARSDSIPLGGGVIDGQYVWGFRSQECGVPLATRGRVNEAAAAPAGFLTLFGFTTAPDGGGPLVDWGGRLAGLQTGTTTGLSLMQVTAMLNQAKTNLATQQVHTLGQVARREHHLYGGIRLAGSKPGTQVRVVPLEEWQWPEAGGVDTLPTVFYGPPGRYRLEFLADGAVTLQAEITVMSGVVGDMTLTPEAAAVAVGQSRDKAGGFPWLLVGFAGAAAIAVVFALGGKGSEDPTTGGITVTFPN